MIKKNCVYFRHGMFFRFNAEISQRSEVIKLSPECGDYICHSKVSCSDLNLSQLFVQILMNVHLEIILAQRMQNTKELHARPFNRSTQPLKSH